MAEVTRLALWQGKVDTDVEVSGKGKPLLYLHGPFGLEPDRAFVARLAASHRVFAPRHPGTTEGKPDAVHAIDNMWDLVVYYGELMDRLGLDAPVLVGHSFGGLVACELAANAPSRVEKLVLIDPIGLWRDDHPVKNWMIMPNDLKAKALFADPSGEAAKRFFAVPQDGNARVETLVALIWAQACTGKYIWPIPDKGLKKHIHRIAAPTLVLWGSEDGIAASSYADEFASRIGKAKAALVDRAGHMPHLEQPERVLSLIGEFLGG
jgi:pimeloyl-ACP methyl ester carboxylesterase